MLAMPSAVMPEALARAPIRSSWIASVPPSAICSEMLPGPPLNVPLTILPATAALVGEPAAIENDAVPSRCLPHVAGVGFAGSVHGAGIGLSPSRTLRPAAVVFVKSEVWKSTSRMMLPSATASSIVVWMSKPMVARVPSTMPSWLSTVLSPLRSRPYSRAWLLFVGDERLARDVLIVLALGDDVGAAAVIATGNDGQRKRECEQERTDRCHVTPLG